MFTEMFSHNINVYGFGDDDNSGGGEDGMVIVMIISHSLFDIWQH